MAAARGDGRGRPVLTVVRSATGGGLPAKQPRENRRNPPGAAEAPPRRDRRPGRGRGGACPGAGAGDRGGGGRGREGRWA